MRYGVFVWFLLGLLLAGLVFGSRGELLDLAAGEWQTVKRVPGCVVLIGNHRSEYGGEYYEVRALGDDGVTYGVTSRTPTSFDGGEPVVIEVQSRGRDYRYVIQPPNAVK